MDPGVETLNGKDEETNHEKRSLQCTRADFAWEQLPFEVYENLVRYIDPRSLVNLCLTSSYIADRVLEPFSIISYQKREAHWYKVCIENLDLSLVLQIFSSFKDLDLQTIPKDKGPKLQNQEDEKETDRVSWEEVFKIYMYYWSVLLHGKAHSKRLKTLENKLKAEILCAREIDPVMKTFPAENLNLWRVLSGGGKIMLNVVFPCPLKELSNINMIVTDKDDICRHISSVCSKTTNSFVDVKIAHFPKINYDDNCRLFDVDKIVLTICNFCVTTTPLYGGVTRNITWRMPDEVVNKGLPIMQDSSLFEVHNNVVVIWSSPKSLMFFLIVPASDEMGYDLCLLYKLQLEEKAKGIWEKMTKNKSYYIPVVKEYKGNVTGMTERSRNILMKQQFYQTKEPVYYGLTLASLDATEIFKPSATDEMSTTTTAIESLTAMYNYDNWKKYFNQIRNPTCSGKGFGMYVFCSNTAIAVSWNGRAWLFGDLDLSVTNSMDRDDTTNAVTHVQVANYNNGLLLVVNEDIFLAEVMVKKMDDSIEIEVKPLRIFETSLEYLGKEISLIEQNFDNGQPFLLIIAKQRSQTNSDEEDQKTQEYEMLRNAFRFAILRIDFDFEF